MKGNGEDACFDIKFIRITLDNVWHIAYVLLLCEYLNNMKNTSMIRDEIETMVGYRNKKTISKFHEAHLFHRHSTISIHDATKIIS